MNRLTTQEDRSIRNKKTMGALINNATRMNGQIIGIPIVDRALSKVGKSLKSKIKTHFGFEFHLMNGKGISMESLRKINDWIISHNDATKNKLVDVKGIPMLLNSSHLIQIDPQTYAIVKIGAEYRKMMENESLNNFFFGNGKVEDYDMYLYIFGKGSYACKLEIENILKDRGDQLRMYKVYGEENSRSDVAFRSLFQDLEYRGLDTIFLDGNCEKEIENHIDNFLANKDLYTGRGIIYKTGILLYGKPGTGKTSLIKALACKYGYDLILIDMTTFDYIELDTMTHSLNIDDRKYIIALEDIDCIIADRENKDIDKDEKKLVQKLLQFLDSNSSPNEVIFIATTNHLELLDEALLREGRFDLKTEIGGLTEYNARRMCSSFNLSESVIDQIIYDIKNDLGISLTGEDVIRQSKLQDMILKRTGMSIRSEVEDEEDTKPQVEDKDQKLDNEEGESDE